MPKRNGSDANGRRPKRMGDKKGHPWRPPPRPRVVTQQKNFRMPVAIVRDAMSPCGNLDVRQPRTAATTAVRP
jgi:hypothetical protein